MTTGTDMGERHMGTDVAGETAELLAKVVHDVLGGCAMTTDDTVEFAVAVLGALTDAGWTLVPVTETRWAAVYYGAGTFRQSCADEDAARRVAEGGVGGTWLVESQVVGPWQPAARTTPTHTTEEVAP